MDDCNVSYLNILLYKQNIENDISYYSAISRDDRSAKNFVKFMEDAGLVVNSYEFYKKGSFGEKAVISFDGQQSEDAFYTKDYTLSEDKVFEKIKEFCNKEKLCAFAALILDGTDYGQSAFQTIGAFISPNDITSMATNTSWEVPEELVEQLMDENDCDEDEATEMIEDGLGYSTALRKMGNELVESDIAKIATFNEVGIKSISELSSKADIIDKIKNNSDKGILLLDESPWGWLTWLTCE